MAYLRAWSHGKQIRHHRGEPRSEAGLGHEAQLKRRNADDIVAVGLVPAWDVQQVGLGGETRVQRNTKNVWMKPTMSLHVSNCETWPHIVTYPYSLTIDGQ